MRGGAILRCKTHCTAGAAPDLSFRLQPLNQRHQRSVDLFTDTREAIFQPVKGRSPLPLRFTGLDQRVELVVLGVGPVMCRAAF